MLVTPRPVFSVANQLDIVFIICYSGWGQGINVSFSYRSCLVLCNFSYLQRSIALVYFAKAVKQSILIVVVTCNFSAL